MQRMPKGSPQHMQQRGERTDPTDRLFFTIEYQSRGEVGAVSRKRTPME